MKRALSSAFVLAVAASLAPQGSGGLRDPHGDGAALAGPGHRARREGRCLLGMRGSLTDR